MRKIIYNVLIIMLLFISSMLFVSCEAITAQNITHTGSTQGTNGNNPGKTGNQGMKTNPGMNGNTNHN